MHSVIDMNLFDLHCDTATRLYSERQGFYKNNFHISIESAGYLTKYAQVMAVWTDKRLSDSEGYKRFFAVIDNLNYEVSINSDKVSIAHTASQLTKIEASGKIPLILAVEDARILENDISKLAVLHQKGVRIITLNWYGDTCIGGAHDTSNGLTDFGEEVVKASFNLGIIPDISHCSFKGAAKTIEIAHSVKKPIIASHSNSYSVNPHSRNLLDEHFLSIVNLGGLVGINLCPEHLDLSAQANVDAVMRHVEYYLALGGENIISMGCDLDGTSLPSDICGIVDIYKIANALQRLNYSTELTEKILFNNAYNFFLRNL